MESKVKEYQQMYGEFEELYECVEKVEEPINEIKKEIAQLQGRQKKIDYNDSDIVIGYMETYINESIAKEKSNIQNEVNNKMSEITNPSGKVKKNFEKAVKWLSRSKADKCLRSGNINIESYISVKKAEKATQFNILTLLNTILAFVFRFDFLRFLPKALRVIAAVIFWAIFLIPKLLTNVFEKYQAIYDEKFSDLSDAEFQVLGDQFSKDFLISCVSSIVITAVVIIAINIVVYMLAKYFAKKFLLDNKAVCLTIIDPNGLKQKMYDTSVAEYMESTVAKWKEEIEWIKNNGLAENMGNDSLVTLVKNDLFCKYTALDEKINSCNEEIESIRKQGEQANTELQTMIPKMRDKEKEVDSLISDSNHNNAVLSPYVSTGYSQHTIYGVKELIYFKHNCKPMLICYGDETAKDGERFRKNAARLVELFMSGFFQENYHSYINMWLVDFEGMYFPESRTKGLMKVVRTQQGVQQMFDELKATRETVDSLEDGRISNINPARLANRENPIKYNIVYFVGYDFTTIDREVSQLFIGGENFGFLPIVFMKKSTAQAMINDDVSARAFSRVVEKMRDNNQIYEFEGLVSEFEYGLMVSNQKRQLDERLCVNKIMSMDDFIAMVEREEGFNVDGLLYLDTYQLREEVYEAIKEIDCIKLFTINGDIPEFITETVIKL